MTAPDTPHIGRSTVNMLTITNAPNLDPIRVITENYQPGQGRIIIQCWDRAWCGAWFSMGEQTIERFFIDADWDYLTGNLTSGLHGMTKAAQKNDVQYLRRIIDAVKDALMKA